MYYYFSQPPYLLLVFGLFAGITSGLAFEATLKEKVQEWYKKSQNLTLEDTQVWALKTPFLGICGGIFIFMVAGLEIFGISHLVAALIALSLTIFLGRLVWLQLGQMLIMLQKGGSQALDLDSFD